MNCPVCGKLMVEEGRDAYVQKLVNEIPLIKDTEKVKSRVAACQKLGGLLSRRYPFFWP